VAPVHALHDTIPAQERFVLIRPSELRDDPARKRDRGRLFHVRDHSLDPFVRRLGVAAAKRLRKNYAAR